MKAKLLSLAIAVALTSSFAQAQTISTIEEYNAQLPLWGVTWAPGAQAVNGYYPTFYTGFAMRSQFPERIHVRTSRGNQTRVTIILDDITLTDYLFDLNKRHEFYRKMTTGPNARLNINPSGAKFVPQASLFSQIVESPTYGIRDFVLAATQGAHSSEAIYNKGLSTLTSLNPGRVFFLRFDLKNEFSKWKTEVVTKTGGDISKITSNAQETIIAINGLLFGRVNYTQKPSAEVMQKLTTALTAAVGNASEDEFTAAALDLFKAVTGKKYDFQVLNSVGQWQKALLCGPGHCFLSYPEFTTVYPTGSAEAYGRDEYGNTINQYATPGLWQFLSRAGKHDVDNIRNEPYYGWAPKMDYEAIGNGFHNPAVRFWGPAKAVKQVIGMPDAHNTLWSVKRGGVSHGCLRLPLGHVWELRHLFPVENDKMTQVHFFGNHSADFDIFDIDGNGTREVMGVEYLVSYGLQGASGLSRREGADLQISNDNKIGFYTALYGAKKVFERNDDNSLVFVNPKISMPSHLDFKKKSVATRVTAEGRFPLYEQIYEKEKVQFYTTGAINKGLIRLMGRVKGCAPTTDKNLCGEAAFDQEAKGYLR